MDATVIDRLADASILVVGDVLLDRYVEGKVNRISREAPVPVLTYGNGRASLGGACNVAANVLSYGGTATLIGVVGDDAAAAELRALSSRFHRLTAHLVTDPGRRTTVKTRYLSGWQQLFCVDAEDIHPLPSPIRDALLDTVSAAIDTADVLVLSDYGRGALDDDTIGRLIRLAHDHGRRIVADPRRTNARVFAGATVLTPNLAEMEAFTGIAANTDDAAAAACGVVLERSDVGAVLLTRGEAGMTLAERGAPPLHIRAETRRVFDVSGAGDTVAATVAAALAAGATLADAVRLANTAAGIVVAKPGTATVQTDELRRAVGAVRAESALDRADAAERVALWKGLGLKVGFTNGCFDLLHRGHLHSLEQASRRVDRLVVGVNSDASTRRLKGPGRPTQDAATRAAILAALRFVDIVVIFEEDTPEELIRVLAPDKLFKGSDYAGQPIPGSEFVRANGGSVELLPILPGHSTTATVRRLRLPDDATTMDRP